MEYFHPARSEEERVRDEHACRHYARSAFPDDDAYLEDRTPAGERLLRADLRRDFFDQCMTEKGWLRE